MTLDANIGVIGPQLLALRVVVDCSDPGAAPRFQIVAEIADHHGAGGRGVPCREEFTHAFWIGLGRGFVAAENVIGGEEAREAATGIDGA